MDSCGKSKGGWTTRITPTVTARHNITLKETSFEVDPQGVPNSLVVRTLKTVSLVFSQILLRMSEKTGVVDVSTVTSVSGIMVREP